MNEVQAATLRSAARRAGLGYFLIAAVVATVVIGSWGANRPHEVRGQWLVVLLLVCHAVLCVVVLATFRSVWRARRLKNVEVSALRPTQVLLAVFAAGYPGIVFYVLVIRFGLPWIRNLI